MPIAVNRDRAAKGLHPPPTDARTDPLVQRRSSPATNHVTNGSVSALRNVVTGVDQAPPREAGGRCRSPLPKRKNEQRVIKQPFSGHSNTLIAPPIKGIGLAKHNIRENRQFMQQQQRRARLRNRRVSRPSGVSSGGRKPTSPRVWEHAGPRVAVMLGGSLSPKLRREQYDRSNRSRQVFDAMSDRRPKSAPHQLDQHI